MINKNTKTSNKITKYISVLLVVMMIFGIVPFNFLGNSVFAQEIEALKLDNDVDNQEKENDSSGDGISLIKAITGYNDSYISELENAINTKLFNSVKVKCEDPYIIVENNPEQLEVEDEGYANNPFTMDVLYGNFGENRNSYKEKKAVIRLTIDKENLEIHEDMFKGENPWIKNKKLSNDKVDVVEYIIPGGIPKNLEDTIVENPVKIIAKSNYEKSPYEIGKYKFDLLLNGCTKPGDETREINLEIKLPKIPSNNFSHTISGKVFEEGSNKGIAGIDVEKFENKKLQESIKSTTSGAIKFENNELEIDSEYVIKLNLSAQDVYKLKNIEFKLNGKNIDLIAEDDNHETIEYLSVENKNDELLINIKVKENKKEVAKLEFELILEKKDVDIEEEYDNNLLLKKSSENLTAKKEKRTTNKVSDILKYTIVAKNESTKNSTLKNAKITDIIPTELNFVENSVKVNDKTAKYTFDKTTNTLVVELGDIKANEEVIITFESEINESAYGKTIINKVKVTGNDGSGKEIEKETEEPGGKEVEEKEVEKSPNLEASKTSKNLTREDGKNKIGDIIEYSIKVKNITEENITLKDTTITDIIPDGVTFVKDSVKVDNKSIDSLLVEESVSTSSSITASSIYYEYNEKSKELTVNLGSLEKDEEREITFEVKIDDDSYGKIIVNKAVIEAKDPSGKTVEKTVEDKEKKTVENKDTDDKDKEDKDKEDKDKEDKDKEDKEKPPTNGGNSTGKPDKPTAQLENKDHFAYIVGYPETNIRPLSEISREEVAVIFYRLLTDESRKNLTTTENPFTDMKDHEWSNTAVSTLYKAGVLKGYKDGTFRPSNLINRAEFAAIASRFDKLEEAKENKFIDIDGHWAEKEINSAEKKGWIKGYEDNTFRPNNNIVRAEAMSLINNVLDRKVLEKNIPQDAKQWLDNPKGTWYYEIVVEASNSHSYTTDEDGNEIWDEIKEDKTWD